LSIALTDEPEIATKEGERYEWRKCVDKIVSFQYYCTFSKSDQNLQSQNRLGPVACPKQCRSVLIIVEFDQCQPFLKFKKMSLDPVLGDPEKSAGQMNKLDGQLNNNKNGNCEIKPQRQNLLINWVHKRSQFLVDRRHWQMETIGSKKLRRNISFVELLQNLNDGCINSE
jgi:hypothetical protein